MSLHHELKNSLMISCPVVGAEHTKVTYPHLPTTPDEIAKACAEAIDAGATIIHLHVRDELGRPSQKKEIFEEVSAKIKKQRDCVLQYSTGGAVGTPVLERCSSLSLKPEMGTLSMGTLNFGADIFENSEATIKTIASELRKYKIIPELEIFDFGQLDTLHRYVKTDWFPQKFHVDFVLGVAGGAMGTTENLLTLVRRLPSNQAWTVAGIGRFQLPLATMAIMEGGHVRVGVEDNIYYKKGVMAKSNAELISRIVRIAKEFDRPIATLEQTRSYLASLR